MATKFSDFAQLDVTTNQSFYVVGYSADNDNTAGTNVQTQQPINFNDYMSTTTHDASTSHKSLSIQSYYGLTDSNNKVTATASKSQSYNPNTTASFNNTTTTGYVDFMIRNKTSGAKFSLTQYYFDSKTNDSASTAYTYDPLSTSTLNLENYTTTGYVDYAIKKKTSAAKFTITEFYASNSDNTQTASKTQNYDPLSTTTLDMDNYCTTGYVDYRFKNFKALPQGSNSKQVLVTDKNNEGQWWNYGTITISGATVSSEKSFFNDFTARNVSNEFLSYNTYQNCPTYYTHIVYRAYGEKHKGVVRTAEASIVSTSSYNRWGYSDGCTAKLTATSDSTYGHVHPSIPTFGWFTAYETVSDRVQGNACTNGWLNIVVDVSGQNNAGRGWTHYDYVIDVETVKTGDTYKGLGVNIQIPIFETTVLSHYRPYTINVNHYIKDGNLGYDTTPTVYSFYLPKDTDKVKRKIIHHNHLGMGQVLPNDGTQNGSFILGVDDSRSNAIVQTPDKGYNIVDYHIQGFDIYPLHTNWRSTFSFVFLFSAEKKAGDVSTIEYHIAHDL